MAVQNIKKSSFRKIDFYLAGANRVRSAAVGTFRKGVTDAKPGSFRGGLIDRGQIDDWFGSSYITSMIFIAVFGWVGTVLWELYVKEPISGMLPVVDHKPKYLGRLGKELDTEAVPGDPQMQCSAFVRPRVRRIK